MLQNPQRLHVGHSALQQNEDIVRASRRLEESGRNDQIVPKIFGIVTILANSLVIRGMFITMAEIRALRFDVHAAIKDLSS